MLLNVEVLIRTVVDCVQEQQPGHGESVVAAAGPSGTDNVAGYISTTAVWHQVLMILY